MKSVGARLRRERIDHGIDLPTLSSLTRISQRYLEAIETGNTLELPSGFFYRSFVRQYASALELDKGEIEAELERLRQAEIPVLTEALSQAKFPIKPQDPIISASNRRYLGSSPTGASVMILIAVLIVCSAFYTWWHGLTAGSVVRREIPPNALAAPHPASSAPRSAATRLGPEPVVLASTGAHARPANFPQRPQPGGITPAQVTSTPSVLESSESPGAAATVPPHKAEPEHVGTGPESASQLPSVPASATSYLQVAALAKPRAKVFVDVLAKKGFHALYIKASGTDTYRVLVGPFHDATTLAQARAHLSKEGYEGYVRNRSRLRRISHRRARAV